MAPRDRQRVSRAYWMGARGGNPHFTRHPRPSTLLASTSPTLLCLAHHLCICDRRSLARAHVASRVYPPPSQKRTRTPSRYFAMRGGLRARAQLRAPVHILVPRCPAACGLPVRACLLCVTPTSRALPPPLQSSSAPTTPELPSAPQRLPHRRRSRAWWRQRGARAL